MQSTRFRLDVPVCRARQLALRADDRRLTPAAKAALLAIAAALSGQDDTLVARIGTYTIAGLFACERKTVQRGVTVLVALGVVEHVGADRNDRRYRLDLGALARLCTSDRAFVDIDVVTFGNIRRVLAGATSLHDGLARVAIAATKGKARSTRKLAALARISPRTLTRRLAEMEAEGTILVASRQGRRGGLSITPMPPRKSVTQSHQRGHTVAPKSVRETHKKENRRIRKKEDGAERRLDAAARGSSTSDYRSPRHQPQPSDDVADLQRSGSHRLVEPLSATWTADWPDQRRAIMRRWPLTTSSQVAAAMIFLAEQAARARVADPSDDLDAMATALDAAPRYAAQMLSGRANAAMLANLETC